ncbi:MAG: aminotransferase class I/II-fold pyridoxal phosphate-dependent enzyme [Kofleriaceae bacterium]|nr:aminotransferase class I/II-fold pyridoxal phosphate-dependent enzyme [Kofleriaceae bacterium]
MLEPVLRTIARGHGYAIFKTFLEKSQWWSTDQRDAWIARELAKTLVSARAVPFYRDRFAAIGFDPRTDFRDIGDLARLPLLTRREVRAERARLCAPGMSIAAHTSGTTGEPLAMRLSASFVAFDAACVFRHWSWAGYELREPVVALRSYVPERPGQALWRYSRTQNTMFFSAYHLTPQNCGLYIDRVLALRPRIIRGYPSTMALFAEYAYPRRAELAFVAGVFTSSETLLDHERETIERTFGNKVFNWYGMTEPALVLTECEQRRGMHVNWEYGHGELLRSDDLPPDEYRLVTTGFHNPVMPLIRYETGDVVRVHRTDRRCACGRTMPLLHSVVGRKDECIYTPDGRRLPSVNFYTMFRAYDELLRFQLVQYGQRELVARIEPRAGRRFERGALDSMRAALQTRVGPAVSVELEVTGRFITNADGKSPPILRRPGTRAVEENAAYAISSQTAYARRAAGQVVHKLDWNEADRVPSRRVRDALVELLEHDESICWYPEARSQELQDALAAYAGVTADSVLVVHGSDAGIELLAAALLHPADTILMLTPAYDQFRAIAQQRGARVVTFEHDGTAPLDEAALERAMRTHAVRLLYLSNPNNPVGYVLDASCLDRIAALCRRLSCILVVDEAYYEFCGVSMARRVGDSPVIVMRTLSKAFGLAGLRVGYLLAPAGVMSALRKIHNPKSVTTFAKVAALAAIRDLDAVHAYVDEVKRGRQRVFELLRRHGARAYPSGGNYILFEWPRAHELMTHLEERGIMVRDRTAYTHGRGSVRVTIGSARSVDALVQALEEHFASEPVVRSELQ